MSRWSLYTICMVYYYIRVACCVYLRNVVCPHGLHTRGLGVLENGMIVLLFIACIKDIDLIFNRKY